MRIIVIGPPKSGTTALFYAIRAGMSPETREAFEPLDLAAISQGTDDPENLLVKRLTGQFKIEDFEEVLAFDKRIFSVRDPRDIFVSNMLYCVRELNFIYDHYKRERYLSLLRKKEARPDAIPAYEIIKMQAELEGFDLPIGSPELMKRALDKAVEMNRKLGERLLRVPYEDFIADRIEEASDYLGFEISSAIKVARQYGSVERSKSSGEWRNWFTPGDIDFFKPYCSEYMREFGYVDEWNLHTTRKIDEMYSSRYVERIIEERINHREKKKRKEKATGSS